ncbi:site-specific integrase [Spirosoma panaciterrae]|uniref:site-specific integrase n=1 Tax=Spirosoma panaciterrae TaxID=496058 RepID=UPI00036F3BF3|nr:site-specific integrase [Spirosoma panaciterrae]
MSATANFYFDTRRQKQDGTYPVKLRITYQRQQRYYPTEINLTLEQWKKVSSLKPREDFIKDTKAMLGAISRRAERVISALPVFSFEEFEKRYSTSANDQPDNVVLVFEQYLEALLEEGRAGTANSYKDGLTAVKAYHNSKKPLPFSAITPAWLKGFEQWMTGKGRALTTVGIYLRSLRTIYNRAIEDGIIDREAYPFSKRRYQIPAGRNVKKALTLSDIEKIYTYPAEEGSSEERYRDLWLFSYLCNGMNPKDIGRLTYSQIDGNYIRFVRAKTQRTKRDALPISIPLTDEVRAIIDRWGQRPIKPNQYIFSILSPGLTPQQEIGKIRQFVKMTNIYVRQIAKAVGVEKDVTTYTARHSFATILKRSGAPTEFISESLGHQSVATTKNYLDSFEDDVKRQYASVLTGFKKSN